MMNHLITKSLLVCSMLVVTSQLFAQRGYYDAPYTRYEADTATLIYASVTPVSFSQPDLQSEASNQVCVDMTGAGSSVEWTVPAPGDGLVVRYSVPDGETGEIYVLVDNVLIDSLELTSYYSWEYLSTNGNPNNVGVQNDHPRMRFDEVRLKLPTAIPAGGKLMLERKSGNIHIDFAELELVNDTVDAQAGDMTYTGDGSDLQDFIDANGGQTIYLPPGVYNVDRELYFGSDNTVLKGAGMWYTQIHFTNNQVYKGGLIANAYNISYSGLYLTTVRNSRSSSYKGINGVYTTGSIISNVWAEHFEVGAWIAQFNSGSIDFADGFLVTNCRFRNNYADGINLSKGTSNTIVEHCSFRNNGDDDMAIWPAGGMSCNYNTYRYNTSENCWRAAGCAIYGGEGNSAHHLLIKDNLEAGLKVNNSFSGAGFSTSGVHEFSEITIIHGGTFNDLYNNPIGAIDLAVYNVAGTSVNNIKFKNIDIIDSKNDAIYIHKANGVGFNNLSFENIIVDGTGLEFPDNNEKGLSWGRGYGVLFVGNPAGYGSYCNMTYTNIGGNALANVNDAQQGTFTWESAGCGTYVTSPTSGALFGECDSVIVITGEASANNGVVKLIEFYVDGYKVCEDTAVPYTCNWSSFTLGDHSIQVRSVHEPSNTVYYSPSEEIHIVHFKPFSASSSAIVIDGVEESIWDEHISEDLSKIVQGDITGDDDLSAYYKITYDTNYLYLLVDVTDDVLMNDGGFNWQNDALEVFIDLGNDKSSGYGTDDYAYTFAVNDATVYEANDKIAGVTFVQGAKVGGYIMEIGIPWSTIGQIPTSGTQIGLDIHVNDDDDGGGRDAKKAWFDCDDDAWNNPSSLGSLQESGCESTPVETDFITFDGELTNNYPVLDWTIHAFDEVDFFRVQRDDAGLGEFQTIFNMDASGTEGSLIQREYTDYGAPGGSSTYRINQLYHEGCFILSDVVNLSVSGLFDLEANTVQFYPNPFTTSGELILNDKNIDNISIDITDITGRPISNIVVSGYNAYRIGHDLKSGVYLLKVTVNERTSTIKIVKE